MVESLAAARDWVHGLVLRYDHEHRHSGMRFVTPAERHRGEDHAIRAERKEVYAAAKQRRRER